MDVSSQLSILLDLAPSSSSSSDLTLPQLIPVHQSLLRAVQTTRGGVPATTEKNDPTGGNDDTALSVLLWRPWCHSTAEAQLCARILSDPDQPWRIQLLVIQYLFAHATSETCNDDDDDDDTNAASASNLWKTLWRFLEENNARFSDTCRPATDDGHEMDVFLRAVVQVALTSMADTHHAEDIIDPWILPDETGNDEIDGNAVVVSDFYWQRNTLLLVAWAARAKATPPATVCDTLVAYFQTSLHAVWRSASLRLEQNHHVWNELSQSTGWKALTQVLLPALVDLLQDPTVAEELSPLLWRLTWGFWKANASVVSNKQPALVLFVTTILCPIFPSLSKQAELPCLTDNDTVKQRPLVEQTDVWEFLKNCLEEGMDALTNEGSRDGNGTLVSRAVSTLIRRRGLYLLRTMTSVHKNLLEWNQYVACFETLEMEEDKHLVSQVWSTVAILMGKASQRTNGPANLPNVSMEWLLLLQGHAVTAADLPFLRKENLYRFFQGHTGIMVGEAESGVRLSEIPLDFVWNIVLPAYDTLERSVGLHVHWIVNGKTIKNDVAPAFESFFSSYMTEMIQTAQDPNWLGPWLTSRTMMQLRAKTTAFVLETVAKIIQSKERFQLSIESPYFAVIADNFSLMFTDGRFVPVYRSIILQSLASILAVTKVAGKNDPNGVLALLSFFPYPKGTEDGIEGGESWIETDPIFAPLGKWIKIMAEHDSAWSSAIPSALASGFVDGMMTEVGEAASWSPGTRRKQEHLLSRSVVFLCMMTADGSSSTASQMLWPAINKGLSLAPSVLLDTSNKSLQRVSRASVLLEHGCKVQILSGNGNGDLVVDRKANQMMPPPPSIEALLSHAVSFLLHMIQKVLSSSADETYASSRIESRVLTAKLSGYIDTLRTFQRAYPSSHAVSEAVRNAFQLGIEKILGKTQLTFEGVQHLSLVYATLDCGGRASDEENVCRTILNLAFDGKTGASNDNSNAILCIFEYSRWGAISKLLPGVFESSKGLEICQVVLDKAALDVEHYPTEATVPLFESAIMTANRIVAADKPFVGGGARVLQLKELIHALTRIMSKHERGKHYLSMLDQLSKVLFQRRLLMEEYALFQKDKGAETPVRAAFRKLLKTAGTRRPHIVRTLLSRLVPGWADDNDVEPGILAIPYRDDIVELLLYKEEKMEASMTSRRDLDDISDPSKASPPEYAHELSLVRSFILVYLSQLTNVEEPVRTELLNYVILKLLERVKLGRKELFMFGSPQHCKMHRGWQALCILSRFVGEDIAEDVCRGVFEAMGEMMHGQTRFFLEIFAIQCTRMHPDIFGKALCANMGRSDVPSQMIASLMIVTGHVVVGRYKSEFLPRKRKASGGNTTTSTIVLDELLSGSIPWLSSTQGFSRAIAQLMVHALIPLAIDVTKKSPDDNQWYLRNLYNFLEENREMKRLRKKQIKFFDTLDVDLYSTVEGCLSVAVDTVGEAIPIHMIEIIKQALKDAYEETHGSSAPTWKQVEDIIQQAEGEVSDPSTSIADGSVNFQRKIIPLDALNIALEEQRDKRLRNVAGRRRQPLIVCASLVDKVPNLGGLARTSEIFAADRLVIPDKSVTKMDNFTSISVSAGDWIEIEECPEKVSRYEN